MSIDDEGGTLGLGSAKRGIESRRGERWQVGYEGSDWHSGWHRLLCRPMQSVIEITRWLHENGISPGKRRSGTHRRRSRHDGDVSDGAGGHRRCDRVSGHGLGERATISRWQSEPRLGGIPFLDGDDHVPHEATICGVGEPVLPPCGATLWDRLG